MLMVNFLFIIRKSVNCSVNVFSNRNMNSAIVFVIDEYNGWVLIVLIVLSDRFRM